MHDHVIRDLHHIAREIDEISLAIFIALENKDLEAIMSLDLTALTALGPRIDAVTTSLSTLISGDVAAAVAATEKADQAQLDPAVADLTTRVTNLENAAKGSITPPPAKLTVEPTSLTTTAGQPLSGGFTATGGTAPYTFTAATSSDGGVSLDTAGAYSGTVAAAGTSTLQVNVSDSSTPPLTSAETVTITTT